MSQDFCFRFFSWIIFPQAPENNARVILNFFKNLQKYLQVKVHHWYKQHQRQNCCHQFHWWCWYRWPVSTLLVASLPSVSTILAANLPQCQWHRRQIATGVSDNRWLISTGIYGTGGKFNTGVSDTSGKHWEQNQTTDNLKWTWRKKFYIYANSPTQSCPKEIKKTFQTEDFFPFAYCVKNTSGAPWPDISKTKFPKYSIWVPA